MTVIEPTDPTTEPDIGLALSPASPYCTCGRCLPDEDYSDDELALDACLAQMLDRIRIVESSTRKARRRTWVSLRALHELIDDARKLLCVQRQTARELASLRERR
jgi:hypothetical protein